MIAILGCGRYTLLYFSIFGFCVKPMMIMMTTILKMMGFNFEGDYGIGGLRVVGSR